MFKPPIKKFQFDVVLKARFYDTAASCSEKMREIKPANCRNARSMPFTRSMSPNFRGQKTHEIFINHDNVAKRPTKIDNAVAKSDRSIMLFITLRRYVLQPLVLSFLLFFMGVLSFSTTISIARSNDIRNGFFLRERRLR